MLNTSYLTYLLIDLENTLKKIKVNLSFIQILANIMFSMMN